MTRILGIDPGNTESAYALIDSGTCRPLHVGKVANADMLHLCYGYGPEDIDPSSDVIAIEMVASYGMAVGAEVFETCVWIGRYQEAMTHPMNLSVDLVYRRHVKLHHCGTSKAKDSNIIQALIDRFAFGQPNRGKGTKAEPGWFYGFAADMWQAYALAVYAADLHEGRTGVA